MEMNGNGKFFEINFTLSVSDPLSRTSIDSDKTDRVSADIGRTEKHSLVT